MPSIVTIDRRGRIVVPKPVRDRLQLEAGDALQVDIDGERIGLSLISPESLLKKELAIWVFQGDSCDQSIVELIDRSREARSRHAAQRHKRAARKPSACFGSL